MIINLKNPTVVKIEVGLTIFYLLYLLTGLKIGYQSNILSDLMPSISYLITLLLVLPRINKILYAFSKNPFLIALIALSTVSFLWSVEPETSLRMGVGIVRTSLFGAYLAIRYDPKDMLRMLTLVLGIVAITSYAVVFGMPGQGIRDGAWTGIYGHKNLLGRRMALGSTLLYFLASGSLNRKKQLKLLGLSVLSGILVILSQSFASLTQLVTLCLLIPFYQSIKLRKRLNLKLSILTFLLFLATLTTSVAIENSSSILNYFGKDPSLTGRTPIWIAMIKLSSERPLLGYGIGNALWQVPNLVARTGQSWDAPDSHNGFLELLAGLGTVGLVLFLVSYFVGILKAISFANSGPAQFSGGIENCWLLHFLVIILVTNFSEDSLFKAGFVWIYYVYVVITLSLKKTYRVGKESALSLE